MKNSLYFIVMVLMSVGVSAQAQNLGKVTQIIEATNRKHIRMRYFRDNSTKLIATRSDADILSDGDISKVRKSSLINDKYRQNQLASQLKLNPYVVNYTVIPDETKHRNVLSANGVKLLSLYYVLDIKSGKSGFGMVADVGPGGQTTNGEFSVHQIIELDLPVDKKTATGGRDGNDIITIIFPQSEGKITRAEIQKYIDDSNQEGLQARINKEGQILLKEYSEKSKTQNMDTLVQDIKSVTMSVPHYD